MHILDACCVSKFAIFFLILTSLRWDMSLVLWKIDHGVIKLAGCRTKLGCDDNVDAVWWSSSQSGVGDRHFGGSCVSFIFTGRRICFRQLWKTCRPCRKARGLRHPGPSRFGQAAWRAHFSLVGYHNSILFCTHWFSCVELYCKTLALLIKQQACVCVCVCLHS